MDTRIASFIRLIYEFGRIEIRDVDGGEESFLYSTKSRGPGYVDIKGGIGIDEFFEPAVELLADVVTRDHIPVDMIVGMMSGGALPAYRLKQHL